MIGAGSYKKYRKQIAQDISRQLDQKGAECYLLSDFQESASVPFYVYGQVENAQFKQVPLINQSKIIDEETIEAQGILAPASGDLRFCRRSEDWNPPSPPVVPAEPSEGRQYKSRQPIAYNRFFPNQLHHLLAVTQPESLPNDLPLAIALRDRYNAVYD